jgi:hypothetical protein
MTLDELIKQLTTIRDEHVGDVPLYFVDDGMESDVDGADYEPAHVDLLHKEIPARVHVW